MKYSFTFLYILLFSWSSFAFSQKFTLHLRAVNFERLTQAIEQKTNYKFVYDPTEIGINNSFSVDVKDGSIETILDQAFKKQKIKYQIIRETIVVKAGAEKNNNFQQSITGTVVDEDGKSLLNVSIRNKSTNTTTATDEHGAFKITATTRNTLVFSSVGFKSKEVVIANQHELHITLTPDLANLDEVVVIGYGTSSVRKNVGSVSSVTAKDLDKQPVLDPLAAMQGRIAGLNISSNSGLPGGSFNVQLRGANSIDNGNNPLYIIDGVPFADNPMNQFTNASGNQSPLAIINPKDIERIDVLKDADATAIYGSRGASGVILITTKKGSAQNLRINAGLNVGNSHAIQTLDLLNTEQYLEIRKEAFKNDNTVMTETNAPDLLTWDQASYHNWQKELFGNKAAFNTMQLSFTGGSSNLQYLFSGNYNKQGDVLPNDKNYQRGGGMLSINSQSPSGRFKLAASANFNADRNNTIASDLAQYYNLAPNYQLYNEDGSYYWFGNSLQNPMAYTERGSVSRSKSLLANSTLSYQVFSDLEAKISLGYNHQTMSQLQTLPLVGFNPLNNTGSSARYGDSKFNSIIFEPQLNYSKQIGDHEIRVLLGGTWQQTVNEGQSITGTKYSTDAQLENIKAAGALTVNGYNYGDYRYQSAFGRINYGYKSKYLFNVSGRRDGSSRFGPNYLYGNFYSTGVAWVFSEEDFLKDNGILSFGKLRGSLGLTGNDQIGNYRYLDTWGPGFAYQGLAGLSPTQAYNPDYRWEENTKRELGLDLGFLKDRIFLTTNYYNNRSGNQLIDIQLAPQTGFDSYLGNQPALVQNSGWEFELSSTNLRKENFSWSSNLNLTIPKNKLLKYPDLENSTAANRYVIGESIRIVKGYEFTGVDPQTGLAQFKDQNGDGALSEAGDFIVMGDLLPRFYGGFNNTLTYKDISLSFLLQFVKQEGPSIGYGPMANHIGAMANMDVAVLDRWQQPGDITNTPRATSSASSPAYTSFRNQYRYSTAVWDDASYLRLKNVALSYDLSKFSQRINIQQMSIHFNAQNLFTWTSFRGMDPEMQGFDRSNLSQVNPFGSVRTITTPSVRTYTFGVQVSF